MNCSNSRGCGRGERLGRMGRTPIECACFSFGRLAADTRVTDRGLGVGRGNWKTIYRGKRRRKSTTTSAVSKGKTPPVSHKFWGEKQTYRLSAFSCKGSPLPCQLPPVPKMCCISFSCTTGLDSAKDESLLAVRHRSQPVDDLHLMYPTPSNPTHSLLQNFLQNF